MVLVPENRQSESEMGDRIWVLYLVECVCGMYEAWLTSQNTERMRWKIVMHCSVSVHEAGSILFHT